MQGVRTGRFKGGGRGGVERHEYESKNTKKKICRNTLSRKLTAAAPNFFTKRLVKNTQKAAACAGKKQRGGEAGGEDMKWHLRR